WLGLRFEVVSRFAIGALLPVWPRQKENPAADLAKCRARARFARGLLASSLTWLQAGRPNHHDAFAIRLARTAVKVEPPSDRQPGGPNRPSRPSGAPWREAVERLDTAAEVRHGRSRQFRGASEWHSACA